MGKYSSEFKLKVVEYYLKNNVGYETTAKYFGYSSDSHQ